METPGRPAHPTRHRQDQQSPRSITNNESWSVDSGLDIHVIEKAVAYLDRVSFVSLPVLPTGTCVVAGISVQAPVVVKIEKLPQEAVPISRTMIKS